MAFKEYSNIIVRMPNWIGDLVMATPILTDLRKAFPNANLTVLCKKPLSELLLTDPDIDEVFAFSKTSGFLRRDKTRDVIDKIKKGHYDLGILLTNSLSSAWWFYRANIKERIGYEGNFFRKFLLTKKLPYPQNVDKDHLVSVYKKLLSLIDLPMSRSATRLYIQEQELNEAKDNLRKFGIPEKATLIGINPGAAYGSAKCWLPERFKEVAQTLVKEKDTYVLFFGDLSQEPLVKHICHNLGPKVINLAATTSLRELAAYIKCCSCLLTNDSGPMHIADALNVPLVALFGSTSEVKTGPLNGGIVIHKHVACSPCFKRECPIDFRCMKTIETKEVVEAIERALDKKTSQLPLF